MKFNIKAFGIASGAILGTGIFLLTVWFILMGYSGQLLSKLSSIYIGYSISWLGAVLGLIYGFIDGFIFGALFAFIYNKIVK